MAVQVSQHRGLAASSRHLLDNAQLLVLRAE